MNIKKITLSALSFALILFFVGGFAHAVLFPDIVARNAGIFREGNSVYAVSFAVMLLHGVFLATMYDYLKQNHVKIGGLKYAILIGLSTSFINIINQLCWFKINDTLGHALIALVYYPLSYLVWGFVLSKIYKK